MPSGGCMGASKDAEQPPSPALCMAAWSLRRSGAGRWRGRGVRLKAAMRSGDARALAVVPRDWGNGLRLGYDLDGPIRISNLPSPRRCMVMAGGWALATWSLRLVVLEEKW